MVNEFKDCELRYNGNQDNKPIKTKFGNASVHSDGYYRITSKKEGNYMKQLHRLIFEDFYKIQLPPHIIIHHNDNDKTNNEIWNLIPLTREEHGFIHNKGKIVSEETKQKMSKAKKGKPVSEETKMRLRALNENRVHTDELKGRLVNH
ncbi:MAG: HNH endonuclease [Methanobrevibacter sp.]|nr:HNH endonuclease [Methanosphaera sp.]MBR0369237.1 HNH endonuclease [Methanobrevibacter sp.]